MASGTKITFFQVEVCPAAFDDEGNDTTDGRCSATIPHVDGAELSCVGAEFSGGGGTGRYTLDFVVAEPFSDEEKKSGGRSKQASD